MLCEAIGLAWRLWDLKTCTISPLHLNSGLGHVHSASGGKCDYTPLKVRLPQLLLRLIHLILSVIVFGQLYDLQKPSFG